MTSTLAQMSRATEVYKHFGDSTADSFPASSILMVVGGLIVVLLAMWGFRRHRSGQLRSAPLMTFHRIANHLDLSLAQQWLMVRISREQALPTPLTMLLSASTFKHHAGLYLEHARPSRRHREQVALNAIARSVFGDKAV